MAQTSWVIVIVDECKQHRNSILSLFLWIFVSKELTYLSILCFNVREIMTSVRDTSSFFFWIFHQYITDFLYQMIKDNRIRSWQICQFCVVVIYEKLDCNEKRSVIEESWTNLMLPFYYLIKIIDILINGPSEIWNNRYLPLPVSGNDVIIQSRHRSIYFCAPKKQWNLNPTGRIESRSGIFWQLFLEKTKQRLKKLLDQCYLKGFSFSNPLFLKEGGNLN